MVVEGAELVEAGIGTKTEAQKEKGAETGSENASLIANVPVVTETEAIEAKEAVVNVYLMLTMKRSSLLLDPLIETSALSLATE